MNDERLRDQITDLINGTITESGHRDLQHRLKADSAARAELRERLDLEAGLRTWSADVDDETLAVKPGVPMHKADRPIWSRLEIAVVVMAATFLVLFAWWTQTRDSHLPDVAKSTENQTASEGQPPVVIGKIVQNADCHWRRPAAFGGGKLSLGLVELVSGVAELRFDSGTNVLLEGPCELDILSADSARLLSGSVFVNVTEVSNGFLLETPDASIVDEGTQYAVVLDSTSTEIHVFDGSVIWTSLKSGENLADHINTGEARRYSPHEPGRLLRIPFGQRKFVKQIDTDVRDQNGTELVAYDGFENLVGALRRGRSGIGWAAGWESAGRGRGQLAEVIDAPNDSVFGIDRQGRRLLLLRGGDSLRRNLEVTLPVERNQPLFVSLLVSKLPAIDSENSSLQIALEPESDSPRFMRRHSVSFGLNASGYPFINNCGTIQETAIASRPGETRLIILSYLPSPGVGKAFLRVFAPDEPIQSEPPEAWTVKCSSSITPDSISSIRLTASGMGEWQVDELRIGKSWNSLVGEQTEEEEE